jgi:hypothetical protein
MLALATMSGLGLHFNKDDDTVAGGGGGDPVKEKEKAKQQDDPKTIKMSKEEWGKTLEDAKAQARAEAKAEADAARKAEKEAAEKKDLEAKGETLKLLEKEREERKAIDADRAALALKLKRSDVKDELRKHLAETHKDYVGALEDIILHVNVEADTKPEEITKQIKEAAAGFVKRNARRMNVAPPTPSGRKPHVNNNENGEPSRMTFTGASTHY